MQSDQLTCRGHYTCKDTLGYLFGVHNPSLGSGQINHFSRIRNTKYLFKDFKDHFVINGKTSFSYIEERSQKSKGFKKGDIKGSVFYRPEFNMA